MPTDLAPDHYQLACKRNGQTLVHAGQVLLVAAALAMVTSLALLISGAICSPEPEADSQPSIAHAHALGGGGDDGSRT